MAVELWLEDGGTQWRHSDVSRAVAIGARRLAADPAPPRPHPAQPFSDQHTPSHPLSSDKSPHQTITHTKDDGTKTAKKASSWG